MNQVGMPVMMNMERFSTKLGTLYGLTYRKMQGAKLKRYLLT